MPGATIRIDQAANTTPTGTPGVARNDIWRAQVVSLVSVSINSTYQWTILGKPILSTATLTNATSQTATFTPDVAGCYRIQLQVNGGGPGLSQILIVAVRFSNVGALVNRGWRIPAVGVQPGEANWPSFWDSTTNMRAWDEAWEFIIQDLLTSLGGGGNLPVGGTPGQILDIASGGSPQWVTPSGDVLFTAAGVFTVTQLQTRALSSTAPTTGQVLAWSGTQWQPTTTAATVTWANDLAGSSGAGQFVGAISGVGGAGGAVPLAITSLAFGSIQVAPSIRQTTSLTTAGQPLGVYAQSAGGTNQSGGNLILGSGAPTGSGAAGSVILQTGGVSGTPQLTVGASGTITCASLTSAGNSLVLATSAGSLFASSTLPSGFLPTLAGDVTGAIGSNTVGKINGATVPAAGALTTGNVLQVTGTSALGYAPVNVGGGSHFVTGVLPFANMSSPTGTGFAHVTTGAFDVAARAVNLGTADVTGALPLANIAQGGATTSQVLEWNGTTWTPTALPAGLSVTGTGFWHNTSGSLDAAARAVNLGTADVTGALPLANIAQGGATASQVMTWNGTVWTPVTPSSAISVTGTGFWHNTGGTLDAAARAVALGSADVSGVLPLGNMGAPIGTGFSHITSGVWDSSARAVNLATADIVGVLPAVNQASQTMAGDVTGTTAVSTVAALQGNPIATTAPTSGQVLEWNAGTNKWTPTSVPGTAVTGTGFWHNTSGSLDAAARAVNLATADVTGLLSVTNGGTGVGSLSAHGVLVGQGTGAIVAVSPGTSGLPLLSTGASTDPAFSALNLAGAGVTGVLPVGNQASQTMGGDVTGTTAASTVVKLQGNPVSAVAPTTNQVLEWNGTTWIPASAPGVSVTGTGFWHNTAGILDAAARAVNLATADVTGALPLANIAQGGAVAGQVLEWSGSTWAPSSVLGGPLSPPSNGSWTQATWFIDPVSGSDSNTGFTSGSPLKTWAKLVQLFGTIAPVIRQNTTITFLSSHSDNTDPVIFAPYLANGASITITGVIGISQQIATGTISGVVSKNRATGQLLNATFPAGVVANLLVVNSTHASHAWTYKQVSGNTYSVSQPLHGATEVDTWTNGDTVTLYQPLNINIAVLKPIVLDYPSSFAGYSGPLVVTQLTAWDPLGVDTDNLELNFWVILIDVQTKRMLHYSSLHSADYQFASNNVNIQGGILGGNGYFQQPVDFFGGIIVFGVQLNNTTWPTMGFFCNFDTIFTAVGSATSIPFIGSSIANFYIETGITVRFLGNNSIPAPGVAWGPGSIDLFEGGTSLTYAFRGGSGSTAVGTFLLTGGITLNNNTTAYSINNATLFPNIAITPSNLDAHAGPTGFGGNAFLLNGTNLTQSWVTTQQSALTQAAWWIDPQAGSDSNTGVTSGTPLKTWAELVRRWGTNAPFLAQTTTVTFLSSQIPGTTPNDPIVWRPVMSAERM